MPYDHITSDQELEQFCQDLAAESTIAFDTEFVSEYSYRPQLCLIQVAAGDRLAVIDPQTVRDMKPFWQLLASEGHDTIVHAGREELLFCLGSVGRTPWRMFDIQIAAGLVGFEYPAGYGSLMFKLLGQRLQKGETRTDWRRRPLSDGQIEYALDDVRCLGMMATKLRARLELLGAPPGWKPRFPPGSLTLRPPDRASGGGRFRARPVCRGAAWRWSARYGYGGNVRPRSAIVRRGACCATT